MRYEDWDILIFPRGSKTPVREFKTACHVVPDSESAYAHGSTGLPTLTCFIPSLPPGTAFSVSLHSWASPEISRFTKSFSEHPDSATFEARVLIDGRLVAYEFLKFPSFRNELLRQSYWNPADELGRIRIIISEGYPRDSATVPLERVKNVMAFSFQHAPLDVLETAAIAWPNPTMWRRAMISPSISARTFGKFESSESHAHSPRYQLNPAGSSASLDHHMSISNMPPDYNSHDAAELLKTMPCTEALLHHATNLPTNSQGTYKANLQTDGAGVPGSMSRQAIMPAQTDLDDRRFLFGHKAVAKWPMVPAEMQPRHDLNMSRQQLHGSPMLRSEEEGLEDQSVPGVPTNTPTTGIDTPLVRHLFVDGSTDMTAAEAQRLYAHKQIPGRLAATLTQSLLNQPVPLPVGPIQAQQPASEVKSRKENRASSSSSAGGGASLLNHNDMRRVSQSALSHNCLGSADSAASTSSPSSRVTSGVPSHGSSHEDEIQVVTVAKTHSVLQPLDDKVLNHSVTGQKSGNKSVTDKGNKRIRQFTPASVKAIDEEDEPRRPSPHLRVTSVDRDA
ncbi:uncharacterized protein B0I36DRAFT_432572 [Microdochium trichocladiopsis]|uniref:Uncharacterized protein n=1 Tax=Microdochium trichocladiopsis TaxID=1682393 RepID=A0A9P8Y130_9PEZI|nr:uncharacterized protein B0I36DRAFT_432572 [Microdochium trichocladiopsis]KAH7027257.1 hypothetical protein B0I36DRAFT_432572 [Microdochium trichocladiopsis]